VHVLLGDLIARFDDDTEVEAAILDLDDLSLLAALRDQAEKRELSLGALAAEKVRRYAAEASDEEWVTLIGTMSRSQNPAAVFLRRAFTYPATQPT
jgi:hypothetical protein